MVNDLEIDKDYMFLGKGKIVHVKGNTYLTKERCTFKMEYSCRNKDDDDLDKEEWKEAEILCDLRRDIEREVINFLLSEI